MKVPRAAAKTLRAAMIINLYELTGELREISDEQVEKEWKQLCADRRRLKKEKNGLQ